MLLCSCFNKIDHLVILKSLKSTFLNAVNFLSCILLIAYMVLFQRVAPLHKRVTLGQRSTHHCSAVCVKQYDNRWHSKPTLFCRLFSSANNVFWFLLKWQLIYPTKVSTECINIVWSFVKCLNSSIGTECLSDAVVLVFWFSVRWYWRILWCLEQSSTVTTSYLSYIYLLTYLHIYRKVQSHSKNLTVSHLV